MKNRFLYVALVGILSSSLLTGCGFSFGYEIPFSKKEAKEEVIKEEETETEAFVEIEEETQIEREYDEADINKDGVVSLEEESEFKSKQKPLETNESGQAMEDDLLKALDELTTGLDEDFTEETTLGSESEYDGKEYNLLGLNFILYEDYNVNVGGENAILSDDSEDTIILISKQTAPEFLMITKDAQKEVITEQLSREEFDDIKTTVVNDVTYYTAKLSDKTSEEAFGEEYKDYGVNMTFFFHEDALYAIMIGCVDSYEADLLIDDFMYSLYFDGSETKSIIEKEKEEAKNKPEYTEETKVGEEKNTLASSYTWRNANTATDIYSVNDYKTLTPKYVKINGLKLCLGDTWEQFANQSTTYTYYLGDKTHSASVYLEKFDGTNDSLVSDYLDAYEEQVKKVFGEPLRVSRIINDDTDVEWIEYVYSDINLSGINVDASVYLGLIDDGIVYLEFVGKDTQVRYSDIKLVLDSITHDAVE